jgi:dihydroxy-acid dehydratase
LVNLKPAGKFLMEDFYYAGGLPVVIREMQPYLQTNVLTVNGKSLSANCAVSPCYNTEVIATLQTPLQPEAGMVVLKGNLCEQGAVIKPAASSAHLLKHRGRAIVFESIEDYLARIDDPDLDIDEQCVMVLKGVGPVGYPGMPEVGNLDLPMKLLQKGIKDMVRISDGRMSGTAGGTVVLHVSPESSVGGVLALVRNGDMIELDVNARKLHLDISEEELVARKANWQAPLPMATRGYVKFYIDHVQQAHLGADLDILRNGSGSEVLRDLH